MLAKDDYTRFNKDQKSNSDAQNLQAITRS
jgi:hypothetical protein